MQPSFIQLVGGHFGNSHNREVTEVEEKNYPYGYYGALLLFTKVYRDHIDELQWDIFELG